MSWMRSGPVTIHFASWSSANTASATMMPRRRSAIHHLVAPRAKLAVALDLRQTAPAAPAFVVDRFHHLPIALVDCRCDEQLREEGRVLVARHPDLGLEARADDLVPAKGFNPFGNLGAKRAKSIPALLNGIDLRHDRPFEQMDRSRVG